MYSELGYISLMQDVTNQKRIIASYDIVEKSLDKLDYTVSYYLVGRVKTLQVDEFDAIKIKCDWKKMAAGMYNVPINIKVLDIGHYELSFEYGGKLTSNTYEFGKEYVEELFSIQIDLAMHVDESRLSTVTDQSFQIRVRPMKQLVDKYMGSLTIENVEYTSILTLTCKDELPTRAKTFLDTLAKVYIDYTLYNEIAINENTQAYIDIQINKIVKIIDSLELAMETFKDARDILDLSKEQDAAFEALTNSDISLRDLELRRESIQGLENFLLKEPDRAVIPPMNYLREEDVTLTELVKDLFQLKQKRSSLLVDVKAPDKRVQRVDSTLQTIRNSIFKYTRDTKVAIDQRIRDLKLQIVDLESELANIPKSERDLMSIERKLKVNEELYTFLLEKKANTVIARAAIIPQTSVIEAARNMGVVGPDRQSIIYLWIGVGILISLLIGLIRMLFFEHIEHLRELKELTKLPVISGIPNYEDIERDPIAIHANPRGNVSEAFRTLRTNLQYLLPDSGHSLILISSLHPGEGKTFVSTNLAATLAKASKKVLLLDFDLHKPKVHKMFRTTNTMGVSTYLIGKASFEEVVFNSDIENLDVVLAGPVPPNASELILSAKVDELVAEGLKHYDYVIIDTPPIMLITDSLVLLS
jgi:capsular exopolysaccharide synthesis family protein